jgi:hypothetical protein
LNINLNINNERQDCEIGTGWGSCGRVSGGEEGNMVDGLHMLIQNRTKKPRAVALSGAGSGWRADGGGDPAVVSLIGTVTMNPSV